MCGCIRKIKNKSIPINVQARQNQIMPRIFPLPGARQAFWHVAQSYQAVTSIVVSCSDC
uniref:Uncharacterized protein n=1 Tax=Periophthalmus magnuspinnatus TaxID=409849 RepID=A0A3B4B521_9GOBI